MKHLRLTGVRHEHGDKHLDLVDEEDREYTVAIDDALRAAVARPAPPATRRPAPAASRRATMSPRDVQARIRAGATIEEMIEASGLDPAHVEHYAGPVHAERFHIAQRARETQIAAASTAEQHRLAFGDAPATLEAMVRVRLRTLGSDVSQLVWDAWRREDGRWQLACWFEDPEDPGLAAELDSPALWIFHAATRHLIPDTPTAQRLHTLPSRPETPRRRLAAVEGPFDVEDTQTGPAQTAQNTAAPRTSWTDHAPHASEAGSHSADSAEPSGASLRSADRSDCADERSAEAGEDAPRRYSEQEGAEHEDLLDILRARRGRRLGADEESDDRLALMLTRDEQPAPTPQRPRLSAVGDDAAEDAGDDAADDAAADTTDHTTEDGFAADRTDDDRPEEHTDAWGFSYAENGENAEESFGAQAVAESTEDDQQDTTAPVPKPKSGRARRPDMPRWDDILFGSRED